MTLSRCAFKAPNGNRCPFSQTTILSGSRTLPVFLAGYRGGLSIRAADGTLQGFPACRMHRSAGSFPEVHPDGVAEVFA